MANPAGGSALLDKAKVAGQFGENVAVLAQKNFGGAWKLAFFTGGVVTTAAGMAGVIGAIGTIVSPFSFCNQVYLIIFGLIMMVIDSPVQSKSVLEAKFSIYRYLLFMTRFTGRGFWYLFLSTMIWASLFNLDLNPFLGMILAAYCATVGVLSLFYGFQKTLELETVRKGICQQGTQTVFNMCPEDGLTLEAFNDLCKRHAKTEFTKEELGYIAAALSFSVRADNVISVEEFRGWTQGKMTVM